MPALTPAKGRIVFVGNMDHGYNRSIYLGIRSHTNTWRRWTSNFVTRLPDNPDELLVPEVIGLIVGPGESHDQAVALHARLPVVVVSAFGPADGCGRVHTDDVEVGRKAAEYLLSMGFKSFGFCGRDLFYVALRRRGFHDTLEQSGFKVLDAPLVMVERGNDPFSAELDQWLLNVPKPIGIMASNDPTAHSITAACVRLDIHVPEEIAIVGVDNDDLYAASSDPALTSISLDTPRIGYEAAEMLSRIITNQIDRDTHVLIPPTQLIERKSSTLAIHDELVAGAVRFIRANVGPDLSVKSVLDYVAAARRTLDLRFMQTLGRTVAAEIRRTQIHRAQELLAHSDLTISDVALRSGFSGDSKLSQIFRKRLNTTPSAYRRKFRTR